MGRIITLSVAVLMTIGGTGVVLSETVKQTVSDRGPGVLEAPGVNENWDGFDRPVNPYFGDQCWSWERTQKGPVRVYVC